MNTVKEMIVQALNAWDCSISVAEHKDAYIAIQNKELVCDQCGQKIKHDSDNGKWYHRYGNTDRVKHACVPKVPFAHIGAYVNAFFIDMTNNDEDYERAVRAGAEFLKMVFELLCAERARRNKQEQEAIGPYATPFQT